MIDDIVAYNNLIYITASLSKRFNSSVAGRCYIFTWDGFHASFLEQIPIEERVVTMIPFGGTLFMATQKYFGYFTGSTIAALYPLSSVVYKYQVGITNDRVYMVQGSDVLCYGNPVVSRPKFFSFPLKHSSTLIGLHCIQTGTLVYSTSAKIGEWSDVNGSDQTGGIFYGNKLAFGSVAKIIGVAIENQELASGSSITLAYLDDKATSNAIATYSFADYGALTRMDWDQFDRKTMTFQPKITFTATPNKGIRRIHIFWEPTEMRPSAR